MGGAHLTPATSPDTLGSEVRGVRDGVAHGRKLAGKDGAGGQHERDAVCYLLTWMDASRRRLIAKREVV